MSGPVIGVIATTLGLPTLIWYTVVSHSGASMELFTKPLSFVFFAVVLLLIVAEIKRLADQPHDH